MIYTIGHGNRAIEEFIALLREVGIECLVDVRAYPASRRHPQFAGEALERSLAEAGIRYIWEGKALGGRRKLVKDSPHVALKNPGFRAYADHMMSAEFREGLARLIGLGRERRSAVMCAERLPWECHRNLIADRLVAGGAAVMHLGIAADARPHRLSPEARVEDGVVIYDAGAQRRLELPDARPKGAA